MDKSKCTACSTEFNVPPRNGAKRWKKLYCSQKCQLKLYRSRHSTSKHRRKWRYNLNEDAYIRLLKTQDYSCAVCKISTNERKLFVDHCHNTGQVRGLLCTQCNTAVGMVKENFDISLNLSKYIQRIKDVV